MERNLCN